MSNEDISDPLFREAVDCIGSGNIERLKVLIDENPQLVRESIDLYPRGYFKSPYLVWFVADNPIRNGRLPANIIEITDLLIKAVKREAPKTYDHQINYTMGLVETGRIPRECGVQLQLIDLLYEATGKLGTAIGAIANGNLEVAAHIIKKGGKLTLTAAICLEWENEIPRLVKEASAEEKHEALVAASFFGKTNWMAYLIEHGAAVNGYVFKKSGFHKHGTALHQAVWSGNLDAVKLLVEHGADLKAPDKIYEGSPIGWANYAQTEEKNEEKKKKYAEIEEYLRSFTGR